MYSVCLQNVMDHKALPQECCESPVNVLDQTKGEDQEKNMPEVRISRTNWGEVIDGLMDELKFYVLSTIFQS